MSHDTEGLWDDIQEGYRWKPILGLLKVARETRGTAARLVAWQAVAAFAIRTGTGKDPFTLPAFVTFALVVELAHTDPRVLATIERMLPLDKNGA
jgi:hypothetical protein